MWTFDLVNDEKYGTYQELIDVIEEYYRIIELSNEQYAYLQRETEKCIARYDNNAARPEFENLRDDFKEIHNIIAMPMLEHIRRLFEADGCSQGWTDSAMEMICVIVGQDGYEGIIDPDLFISHEPIYVKNGLIHNYDYGVLHIVSFDPNSEDIEDDSDDEEVYYYENFHQLNFSEGVVTIESDCIIDCDEIDTIYLPSSLCEVAWGAFKNLPRLKFIIIRTYRVFENKETRLSDAFDFLPHDCTIFVPFWLVDAYSEHEFWGRYNIESWIEGQP